MVAIVETAYVTDTDQFLPVTDEMSLIQGLDDRNLPDTEARTFAELEEAAVSDGPGSDSEKVRDHVMAVLKGIVQSAERIVESFGLGYYIIPYSPIDAVVVDLVRDWAWFMVKARRGVFNSADDQLNAERNLRTRGIEIRNRTIPLTAVTLEDGYGSDETVHDWGSAESTLRLPSHIGDRRV